MDSNDAMIGRHLGKLAAEYPAFRFAHEAFGRKGARWIAERCDRNAAGLRVAITSDLIELRTALARDENCHGH